MSTLIEWSRELGGKIDVLSQEAKKISETAVKNFVSAEQRLMHIEFLIAQLAPLHMEAVDLSTQAKQAEGEARITVSKKVFSVPGNDDGDDRDFGMFNAPASKVDKTFKISPELIATEVQVRTCNGVLDKAKILSDSLSQRAWMLKSYLARNSDPPCQS